MSIILENFLLYGMGGWQ